MFLGDLLNSGAAPALELTLRFAGQRHEILTHNIANLTTPGFVPRDVSVGAFREALARAIEDRREGPGRGAAGALEFPDTGEIRASGATLTLEARSAPEGVLFHDRGQRDIERLMADLAENTAAHRVAGELLRTHHAQITAALAERVA